jgi:hypothetical protein
MMLKKLPFKSSINFRLNCIVLFSLILVDTVLKMNLSNVDVFRGDVNSIDVVVRGVILDYDLLVKAEVAYVDVIVNNVKQT